MTIASMNDANLQLIRALRRRWPNREERAAALGLSTRQLTRWEFNDEIPQIVSRLIELSIITVVEDQPADPIAA